MGHLLAKTEGEVKFLNIYYQMAVPLKPCLSKTQKKKSKRGEEKTKTRSLNNVNTHYSLGGMRPLGG